MCNYWLYTFNSLDEQCNFTPVLWLMFPIHPHVWRKTAFSFSRWCGSGRCIWNKLCYSVYLCKLQIEYIHLFLSLPTECFHSHPTPCTFSFFLSNNLIFSSLLFLSFSPPPSADLSWPCWFLCAGALERWEIGKWRRASDQSSLPLCFAVSLQRQHPYPDWKVISPFCALHCLHLTPLSCVMC